MVYVDRKKRKTITLVFIFCITIVVATLLITKEQDFSQPCRILSINQHSITAEEWNSNYWQGGLMKIEIPVTNCEAEVGDFINLRGEFVDCSGNIIESVPERIGNVYAVTAIDETVDAWIIVQGPLTYETKQGASSMKITNPDIKIGDLINDAGQKVDMFGNLA